VSLLMYVNSPDSVFGHAVVPGPDQTATEMMVGVPSRIAAAPRPSSA
jgi:hypothetical protein